MTRLRCCLRHLWATDGSVTVPKPGQRGGAARVYFSSCSMGLVQDVAALLLRLGIVARIRTVHTEGYRPCHTVDVSGGEHSDALSALSEVSDRVQRAGGSAGGWRLADSQEQTERRYAAGAMYCSTLSLPCASCGITRSRWLHCAGSSRRVNLDHSPSRTLICSIRGYSRDDETANLRVRAICSGTAYVSIYPDGGEKRSSI